MHVTFNLSFVFVNCYNVHLSGELVQRDLTNLPWGQSWSAGTYTITVGSGGNGGFGGGFGFSSESGSNGGDTSISYLTTSVKAKGGGSGATYGSSEY